MSLESNIAALVAASTELTQAVNITKATVEATRDSTIAKEAPVTTAKDAVLASTTAATTDAATTGTKLAAAAADYATQKTTKGLAAVQTSAESELKDRLHRRDPARHPFRGARPSLVMDFVRRECHRNNAAGNLEPVDLSTFMTFTRGSTATYVGPDGLIKTAGVNKARYGYDPVTGEALGLLVEEQRTNFLSASDPYWWAHNGEVYVLPCVALAPNGTLSAARVIGTSLAFGNGIWNSCTISATGTITLSVYIKAVATGKVRLSAEGGSINNGSSCEAYFNPLSGYSASGVTAGSTASSVNVGGGWYRIWLTAPATSTTDVRLVVYGWDNTMFTDFYIWGAQVEAGSFPTSYIPTPATFTGRASTKTYFDSNGVMQTAASGVAATDYGYVDGRWISKGLSLEGKATNLLLYSEQLDNAAWGKNGASVITNVAISPDGTQSADALIEDVNFVAHRIIGNYFSASASSVYTFSVFVKPAGRTHIYIRLNNSGGDFVSGTVRLADAVVTQSIAGSISATRVGNGWVRIVGTGMSTVTANTYPEIRCGNSDIHASYSGDGVSGLYIWGAQLETGPVATSYIPTTTAQVTRAADTSTSAQVTRAEDDAKLNSITTWYNQDCGASVLGYRRIAPYISGLYPGGITFGGDMASYFTSSAIGARGRGVTRVTNVTSAEVNTNGLNTIQTNRDEIVLGAVNGIQRTSLKKTVVVTSITLGKVDQYLNGYIRQLTYFPRQLSDADLQALTILED